jgi:tetratricopeptide (TPR) repeat protein
MSSPEIGCQHKLDDYKTRVPNRRPIELAAMLRSLSSTVALKSEQKLDQAVENVSQKRNRVSYDLSTLATNQASFRRGFFAYLEKGMYAEALAISEQWLQSDPTNQLALRNAGFAYAKARRRDKADREAPESPEVGLLIPHRSTAKMNGEIWRDISCA